MKLSKIILEAVLTSLIIFILIGIFCLFCHRSILTASPYVLGSFLSTIIGNMFFKKNANTKR